MCPLDSYTRYVYYPRELLPLTRKRAGRIRVAHLHLPKFRPNYMLSAKAGGEPYPGFTGKLQAQLDQYTLAADLASFTADRHLPPNQLKDYLP